MQKSKLQTKIQKCDGVRFTHDELRYTNHESRATGHGFTLVELLLALSVASIVLAAITTLAFALSSAADSSDDTARKQSELRYATLRISELIRECRLICSASESALIIWASDVNNPGRINMNELVYIQKGPGTDLRLYQFPSSYTDEKSLAEVATLSPADYGIKPVILLPQCSDVRFILHDENGNDSTASPPRTKFVSFTFDLTEDDVVHHYQINTALRCWAGNLLDTAGDAIVSDDD